MQEARPWKVCLQQTLWDWTSCCWCCFNHPENVNLLPNTQDNVVTVRRISRVQSTESLSDEVGTSSSPILYTPGCGWRTRPTELQIAKEPKAEHRSTCELLPEEPLELPANSNPFDEGSEPLVSPAALSLAATTLNCSSVSVARTRSPPPLPEPTQSFAPVTVTPQVYQRTIFPPINPPAQPPTPTTPSSPSIGWIGNLFEAVRRASLSSVGSSTTTPEDGETCRGGIMMRLHEDEDSSDNDCGGYNKHDDLLVNSSLGEEERDACDKDIVSTNRSPHELVFTAASLAATVSALSQCKMADDHRPALLYGDMRGYPGDHRNSDKRKVKEEGQGERHLSSKEGEQDTPARECFGALTLSMVRLRNSKVLMVALGQLTGLPWVGGVGVMLLEVSMVPAGGSQWISLPRAYGPQVHINMEVQLRLPRDIVPGSCVRVSVWTKDRSWKYCALGHALASLSSVSDIPQPVKANLEAHTQIEQNHGLLEVGLQCLPKTSEVAEKKPHRKLTTQTLHMSAVNTKIRFSKQMKSLRHAPKGHDNVQVGEEVVLVVDVLRSRDLRFKFRTMLSKMTPSKLRGSRSARERMEMLCYITAWVRGERVHRRSTPPVTLPVTRDPVFRSRVHLTIAKNHLQDTAVVIKVCARSSWGQEVVVGRVVLGPLLYLGSSEAPDPPIKLSHWGRALQSRLPVNMWHHLQL